MGIRVDFTDVKSGFEPIPEGKYEAVVFEVEQKVGQNSGKPYLNWQLKIQGGEFDGRRLFYMTSLSPNALWKLKTNLIALGYTKEEVEGDFDLDLPDLCGRECTVVVTHEEYQGEMRDRVADILEAGGAESGDASLYR
jgi:hypothetical protein